VKILVLGQGAREHAIVKALVRTGTSASDIIVAPGNAGIALEVRCEPHLNPNNPLDVVKFALEHQTQRLRLLPEYRMHFVQRASQYLAHHRPQPN
jgi:phosphoribosylamine--glycine ligase